MFTSATKNTTKIRIALTGPSGSGKTLSALRIAQGLGGTIALIDTERGSASLYSDAHKFLVNELTPPYSPQRYIDTIHDAEQCAASVLIIDSLSHAWAGEGGVLETVDQAQEKGGNKFAAWGPATRTQNALINAILASPLHVIATFRSKQEYTMSQDAKGRTVVKKLGMAPIQRDGVEYEFTTVLDLDMLHQASVGMTGKDRTGLFTGEPHILTEADGQRLAAWLGTEPAVKKLDAPHINQEARVLALATQAGYTQEALLDMIVKRFGVSDFSALTRAQADTVETGLNLRLARPPGR